MHSSVCSHHRLSLTQLITNALVLLDEDYKLHNHPSGAGGGRVIHHAGSRPVARGYLGTQVGSISSNTQQVHAVL